MTRGEKTQADIAALLRARNTCLWIVTREELRVERAITEAAAGARYEVAFWDCATGLTDAAGKPIDDSLRDPQAALRWLGAQPSGRRLVLVCRDLHRWLDPVTLRILRSEARRLQSVARDSARAIVILTPSSEIPLELQGTVTTIDYPIPDRAEMAAILDGLVENLQGELSGAVKAQLVNGVREAAIDAAVGLTADEAVNCYTRSLVTERAINPRTVGQEKKRVIAREKVLTWHDPDPRGLEAIGGLEALKAWLAQRRLAFSARARAYGLPAPKGALLVGVPGCGKSLTAKAIATAWGMPLLRLDMGALRSKYVGESEQNIRKALQVAEAVSPCILWLDEIEKALGGSTGPQGDGGVAADALGAILSWMQERTSSTFVLATANDVRALPPELLRKGRFDEVFWVDLPTSSERAAIVAAACGAHNVSGIDAGEVSRATPDFTGAELAAIVPDALFTAFADGERAATTADLLAAAKEVVPLAKTAADKITELRKWAVGRARPASLPETVQVGPGRDLDV